MNGRVTWKLKKNASYKMFGRHEHGSSADMQLSRFKSSGMEDANFFFYMCHEL